MHNSNIKVSILILTHNRPKLFKRCIGSVVVDKPEWAEIIVNNDSNDIEEIEGAKYYYEKHKDLSKTYKFLWDKSKGDFIYYLEDDDYVVTDFWKILRNNTDLDKDKNYIFNYIPHINTLYYKYFNDMEECHCDAGEIGEKINKEHFQLGMVLFYKDGIDGYVSGNKLENDYLLLMQTKVMSVIIKKPIYKQTTDGKDNISWTNTCNDKRFVGHHKGKK